ncbi:hypothetical protein VB741_12365 [Leptothoe sp. PORK10 BA2]|nr:hypothetical protein [Leptothoe sp. PORK10 BA2]
MLSQVHSYEECSVEMTTGCETIRPFLDKLEAEQLATLTAILNGQSAGIPFASVESLIIALGGRVRADRNRGFWQIALSINGARAPILITPLKPFYAGEMFLSDLRHMLLSVGFRVDCLN